MIKDFGQTVDFPFNDNKPTIQKTMAKRNNKNIEFFITQRRVRVFFSYNRIIL
jgi:hypothetical protein